MPLVLFLIFFSVYVNIKKGSLTVCLHRGGVHVYMFVITDICMIEHLSLHPVLQKEQEQGSVYHRIF